MIFVGLISACVVSRVWVTLSLVLGLALDSWLALPPTVTGIFGVGCLAGWAGVLANRWWMKGPLNRYEFIFAFFFGLEFMVMLIARAMTGRFSPAALIGIMLMNGAIAAIITFAGAPILFVAFLAASSLLTLIGFSTDAGLLVSPFPPSPDRDILLRYLHSIPDPASNPAGANLTS
jgi:hypothetical protein